MTRHQYQSQEQHTFAKFISQSSAYGHLLSEQWLPWFLISAAIALVVLFKTQRKYFYLSLLLLLFTGPVTTYITNFDVASGNSFLNAENKALVSVFYIPSYVYLSVLMALGMFTILQGINAVRIPAVLTAAMLIGLPLSTAYINYRKLDMSRYYFTEDYVHNLFGVVTDRSLVMVNWDPFSFPLNYYQFVENKRRDVMVIDQELLRRSWYIRSLQEHCAEFMEPSKTEVGEFLRAVTPFEDGEKFDPGFIQQKYLAMINALIDHTTEAGHDVYLTYDPPPGVAEKYFKESVIAAVKLRKDLSSLTPVDFGQFQFRNFFDPNVPSDRMARFFKTYYGRLFFARAFVAGKVDQKDEALRLYKQSSEFMNDHPDFLQQINAATQTLNR
jgi:hypothetical protein